MVRLGMWSVVFGLMCMDCVDGTCPSYLGTNCDISSNVMLFPDAFIIFGAFEGQVYTVGNVVILVAKFPDFTCRLPDLLDLDPLCTPTMIVNLFTSAGLCQNVTAVSNSVLEENFGFSFADDPTLETPTGVYSHWSFPLYILDGMSTSRLEIKTLLIPNKCNGPLASFANNRQFERVMPTPRITIDTSPPQIISLHIGKASGVYGKGDVMNIVAEFSEDMDFSILPGPFAPLYAGARRNADPPRRLKFLRLPMESNALARRRTPVPPPIRLDFPPPPSEF